MVPAAQKVRAAIKSRPAVHRVASPVAAKVASAAAVPCSALTPIALGDGLPGLSPATFSVLDESAAMSTAGFSGGASGAPGTGGAGPLLPLAKPGIGLPSLPNTSPAPEVTTWSMMVVGAGVVGGTLRWRRREQAA
jgi:hypothetical protein